MPGTRHEMKQLRYAVQEIHYLRYEEKQCRFAEMPEYADNGERHSWQVAERIANEDLRRIPEK